MKLVKSFVSPTYGIIRALLAIAIGVAMLVWLRDKANIIIQIIGAALILVGGVSIAIASADKDKHSRLLATNGTVSLLFGLMLIRLPEMFAPYVCYLLGLVVLMLGIGQIFNLIEAGKFTKVNAGHYTLPAIVSLCGIVMLFWPVKELTWVLLIFGIDTILYGISELIFSVKFRNKIVDGEVQ